MVDGVCCFCDAVYDEASLAEGWFAATNSQVDGLGEINQVRVATLESEKLSQTVDPNSDLTGIARVCETCGAMCAPRAGCSFCGSQTNEVTIRIPEAIHHDKKEQKREQKKQSILASVKSKIQGTVQAWAQKVVPALHTYATAGREETPPEQEAAATELDRLYQDTKELLEARISTLWWLNAADAKQYGEVAATSLAGYTVACTEDKDACLSKLLSVPKKYIPEVRAKRKSKSSKPPMSFKMKKALQLAQCGYLSRAAKTLLQDGEAIGPSPEVYEKLLKLHPAGPHLERHERKDVGQWVSLGQASVKEVVRKAQNGASPGPSGWTAELLNVALKNPTFAKEFTSLMKDILNGDISERAAELLRMSRLVALPKPDAGIRPIAMGEVIVAMAARIAMMHVSEDLGAEFQGLQFALDEGGAEKIVHVCRRLVHEGHTVIAVDFCNAFNCVDRQRVADAVSHHSKLVRLFDLMYAAPSRLLWSGGTIMSTNGTRQGDVMGPALFCMALHPVLKHIKEKFPAVRIMAYMDDVTLASKDKEQLRLAFLELEREAAKIGLTVNKRKNKTCVFGRDAVEIARGCGITACEDGIKCLGAWITNAKDKESSLRFVAAVIAKHEMLFKRIKALNGEAGFAILRFCAQPKLNYLARTMSEIEVPAKQFDERMEETFKAIAEIEGELTPTQKMVMHLPLKRGGIGLRRYEVLSQECYEASLNPDGDSQEVRTTRIDEELETLVCKDQEWAKHLRAARCRKASLWMEGPAPDFDFERLAFARALQLRLRYAPPWGEERVASQCQCGYTSGAPAEEMIHALGCAVRKGMGPSTRHNAVRDVVGKFARERGATVMIEPEVEGGRADITVICPQTATNVTADFTIANTTAKSYVAGAVKKKKDKKYGRQDVIVAEVAVLGGFTQRMTVLTKAVAPDSDERHELEKVISKTVQAMNGEILKVRLPSGGHRSADDRGEIGSEEEGEGEASTGLTAPGHEGGGDEVQADEARRDTFIQPTRCALSQPASGIALQSMTDRSVRVSGGTDGGRGVWVE